MKDVREMHHIPNIEFYSGLEFKLDGYCVNENNAFYTYEIDKGRMLFVDIISDEKLIEPKCVLHDLLYANNVSYLNFQIRESNTEDLIDSWQYRPLVSESEKQFIY